MTVLLQGVVGSTAYGLAREGSDVDRLGVFAAPTERFLGLDPPTGKNATIVQHGANDITLHEVGKFCALALQCNPSILELLWLPGFEYDFKAFEICSEEGMRLVYLRRDFLSKKRVRDAYFGYATQQFQRLSNKQRFPDVPINRIEKHARHLLRLLHQGLDLYRTGYMNVRVTNPDEYFYFGQLVAAGNLDHARAVIASHEQSFDNSVSALPDEPRRDAVEEFLIRTRKDLL